MAFTTLTIDKIRKQQYIDAITFYLENTTMPIIFTENSGTDISQHFSVFIRSGRLEILTFHGNENKIRGKGYGEAEIIDYTLRNSNLISIQDKNYTIVKITGRLIVHNIESVVHRHFSFQSKQAIQITYNLANDFPDSRLIVAPIAFFRLFIEHKEEIDDGANVFFEHVLSTCIKKESVFRYYPFFVEPQITGQSGTTGELYIANINTFRHKLAYLTHSFRTLLFFDRTLSKNKINTFVRVFYTTIYYGLKLAEKTVSLLRFP